MCSGTALDHERAVHHPLHNFHSSLALANLELGRSSLLLHHVQSPEAGPVAHTSLALPEQGKESDSEEQGAAHTSRALLEQLGVYDWEEYWTG